MRKKSTSYGGESIAESSLLIALSDDLALPLLQIKSTLELLEADGFSTNFAPEVQLMNLSAENGLQLVEAYRLALKADEIQEGQLEPISIGAVLQDVAHKLTPYAQKYTTDLEVDVRGKLTPVLAHLPSLTAALQVLSTSLIRAQAAQKQQKRYRLLLGAHRGIDNVISTGVFSGADGLSDKALRTARGLVGRARQPMPSLPAGAASGVLIADMLCSAMWQPLRSAAHQNMRGLVTVIPVSKQLQFI